jgi:hypothetical protein
MSQGIRNPSKRNEPLPGKDLDASNTQLLKLGSGSALDISSSAVKENINAKNPTS